MTRAPPHACAALRNLAASNAANKDAIRDAGGIAQLVAVLDGGATSLAALQAAAGARPPAHPRKSRPRARGCLAPRRVRAAARASESRLTATWRVPRASPWDRALAALRNLASNNTANQHQIRGVGGIEALITLVRSGANSIAAQKAAGAVRNLASNTTNQDAIREAGGIAPLVALLVPGAPAEAVQQAAGAVRNLAANHPANKDAIREAGGIGALVSMLRAGVVAEPSQQVAGAIWSLAANNPTNQDAIREAGGIAPLVALLHTGADSMASQKAAGGALRCAHLHLTGSASAGL